MNFGSLSLDEVIALAVRDKSRAEVMAERCGSLTVTSNLRRASDGYDQ